ncbi:hypothetical protein RRG08_065428 [Elysia crispata]|uniref:Uncharacterized protein n=1 Tax=Elysia crispata TaxID=231223 RepID=A0AAE0ZEJ0_9GAST|nr:hypothetical protein RRG08_065428 [Elysia crispata]
MKMCRDIKLSSYELGQLFFLRVRAHAPDMSGLALLAVFSQILSSPGRGCFIQHLSRFKSRKEQGRSVQFSGFHSATGPSTGSSIVRSVLSVRVTDAPRSANNLEGKPCLLYGTLYLVKTSS